jgi:hypothetical protein
MRTMSRELKRGSVDGSIAPGQTLGGAARETRRPARVVQPAVAAGLSTPTALAARGPVLADRDALPRLVLGRRPVVAELGVEAGLYADVYTRLLPDGEFHFVDMWETTASYFAYGTQPGRVERGYQRCVRRYGDDPRVRLVRSVTWEAAERYEDGTFDFIYVDADHSEDGCRRDIEAWYPKLKRGGVIAGHDFDPGPEQERRELFGVDRAVRACFGEDFALTGEPAWKSWWHIKP